MFDREIKLCTETWNKIHNKLLTAWGDTWLRDDSDCENNIWWRDGATILIQTNYELVVSMRFMNFRNSFVCTSRQFSVVVLHFQNDVQNESVAQQKNVIFLACMTDFWRVSNWMEKLQFQRFWCGCGRNGDERKWRWRKYQWIWCRFAIMPLFHIPTKCTQVPSISIATWLAQLPFVSLSEINSHHFLAAQFTASIRNLNWTKDTRRREPTQTKQTRTAFIIDVLTLVLVRHVFVSSIKPIRSACFFRCLYYILFMHFAPCRYNWHKQSACAPLECYMLLWFHCVHWIVESATAIETVDFSRVAIPRLRCSSYTFSLSLSGSPFL